MSSLSRCVCSVCFSSSPAAHPVSGKPPFPEEDASCTSMKNLQQGAGGFKQGKCRPSACQTCKNVMARNILRTQGSLIHLVVESVALVFPPKSSWFTVPTLEAIMQQGRLFQSVFCRVNVARKGCCLTAIHEMASCRILPGFSAVVLLVTFTGTALTCTVCARCVGHA